MTLKNYLFEIFTSVLANKHELIKEENIEVTEVEENKNKKHISRMA